MKIMCLRTESCRWNRYRRVVDLDDALSSMGTQSSYIHRDDAGLDPKEVHGCPTQRDMMRASWRIRANEANVLLKRRLELELQCSVRYESRTHFNGSYHNG